MKQRPRIYYSDSQKALMWERWKQGWTLQEIGKLFDRAHSSIHRILAETGGIRPVQRLPLMRLSLQHYRLHQCRRHSHPDLA